MWVRLCGINPVGCPWTIRDGIDVFSRIDAQYVSVSVVSRMVRCDSAPTSVLDCLIDAIEQPHAGGSDRAALERNHVSKSLEEYTQNTRNVTVLERACDHCLADPGQDVEM